jgi:diguanylate cyclase (GGDEF)-like protein
MRLIDRNDTSLVAGLILGAVVIFHQPLRMVLDTTQQIETDYHLDLLPALVGLSVLFVLHHNRKHYANRMESLAVATTARQQFERAEELQALVVFGKTLTSALDMNGLRDATSRSLSVFARDRGVWVMLKRRAEWHALIHDSITDRPLTVEEMEALATIAVARSSEDGVSQQGVTVESYECFVLSVGGKPTGVLAVRQMPPLSDRERRLMAAASSIVGIAARNVQLLLDAQENSVRDELTGCVNKKHALEVLEVELRRANRSGRPLSVAMVDLDRFKQINDRYGHLCGDEVLTTVGNGLKQVLRTSDVKCRYGGDEFLLILPDTPPRGAEQLGQCLAADLSKRPVTFRGAEIHFAVSVGVATARVGDTDAATLIGRADEALYEAKTGGRNRCCVAPPGGDRRDDGLPAPDGRVEKRHPHLNVVGASA